jgi:hypothetical protein
VAAAAALSEACARCVDNHLLPTLDTIGPGLRGAQFVGLMPAPSAAPPPRPSDVDAHIARELSRMLTADLVARRPELAERVTRRRTSLAPWDVIVAAALADRAPPSLPDIAPRS